MSDELRGIAEFDHIFVSKNGQAYQKVNNEMVLLDRRRDDRNKCMIAFKDKGKRKQRELCYLILEAWAEKPMEDRRTFYVVPRDGDVFNCALDNLLILKKSPLAGRELEIDNFVNRTRKV